MRLFFATDIHGSEVCFRKVLNAGRFYGADVIILGGDVTGKLLVPIVRRKELLEASFQGRQYVLSSSDEVHRFKKVVRDCGSYYVELAAHEFDEARSTPDKWHEFFIRAMKLSIRSWLELADSRLRGSGIECYMMLGNDDAPELAEELHSECVINAERRKVALKDSYEMISLGFSNRTPFDSPREMDEDQLGQRVAALASSIEDMSRCVFNLHVPPRDSGLDKAPELDNKLAIKSYGGQPREVPVGSTAVREAIEKYQPLLGLHGHVHESRGDVRIGRTVCVNPGSSYAAGVLQGILVDLNGAKVQSLQHVSG